ncbi:hypothetical protein [uncultured Sphingomonas sp.]|uniref:hypothetical protein n=1 Tax=uncultured Sphingomonas sp. TaxID=158754 RepID=UPI0035CC316C
MQTSPPPGAGADPFSAVEAITTAHLILIAAVAVIVLIAMVYGARLKRRRTLAQREEQERLDAYADEHRDALPVESSQVEAPPSAPVPPAEPGAISPREGQRPLPPVPPAQVQSQSQTQTQTQTFPEPVAASPAGGPVTQLKGLGPKVAARLAELGITCVGQIAALDDDAADAIDASLGAFQGRLARDRWVEQARFLAAGDRAGFEAVFGRL